MKTNQRQKIINYINKNGYITSYKAYMDLGITQLATRISELKEQGYIFTYEWVRKKKQNGQLVKYKKYKLANELIKNEI
mgnify:CR=1 FL=1